MVYSTNHTNDPHTQVCHVRIYYDDLAQMPLNLPPVEEQRHISAFLNPHFSQAVPKRAGSGGIPGAAAIRRETVCSVGDLRLSLATRGSAPLSDRTHPPVVRNAG